MYNLLFMYKIFFPIQVPVLLLIILKLFQWYTETKITIFTFFHENNFNLDPRNKRTEL